MPGEAVALERHDGRFAVELQDGGTLHSRAVLIATGARYRRLPVARLEELESTSVYYAATPIEARVCRGDPVVIVGGGNSAGQATLFLHKHAAQVTLVVREPALGVNMSRYLADQIVQLENVEVLLHHEPRELRGRTSLDAVVVEDIVSHERRALRATALFVFIGARPRTEWLGGQLELDAGGYILTGPDTGRSGALFLETSEPGVFAAGDVRHGSIMRVASAVGEGAMAVKLLHAFLHRSRDVVESMAVPR